MAANTINLKLIGVKELEDKLKGLGPKVAKRILRGAVQSGANPIVKAARAKVPVRFGLLKKCLGVKTKTYKNGTVASIIGPRWGFRQTVDGQPQDPGNYAHLVEFGTAAHMIHAYPGKVLKVGDKGFAYFVRNPGTKAHPFLRPAMDENKFTAIVNIRERLAKGIEREAKR